VNSGYDRIFIAPGNPLTCRWERQWFKTHDLHGCGNTYELCELGLLWHLDNASANPLRQIAIHRDLVLISGAELLVARFCTAAVEWIRPYSEIGKSTREFLHVPRSEVSMAS
jgi:hypothetical protein